MMPKQLPDAYLIKYNYILYEKQIVFYSTQNFFFFLLIK